ncbi:cyclase family protein [Dactylosporangium sp. NPDC005572]|uniref:cyclase family protein n=1 Tax=Dactylosporangium sp. NPDC005572 TaxID=3156889 RepID=UPI0033A5A4E5
MWPTYAELEAVSSPASAWHVFGPDDELGTINFLTPEVRRRAATLVRTGRTFNLDYALDAFEPFPSGTRSPYRHSLFSNNPLHFDDWVDSFYLQATSQIDGLRHIGYPGRGFYNGHTADEFQPHTPTLGIQRWADAGIVGRGVLLDVERHLAAAGRPIDPTAATYLTVDDLEATARAQGVEFADGDILLIRTGWAEHCRLHMDADARRAFKHDIRFPGLTQSRDMVAWLWDHHFALVASDNLGVEAAPNRPGNEWELPGQAVPAKGVDHNGSIHRPLIALLGLALGEMWALHDLAADCAADGVYEFLLTAKPLNLVGGVGSTANALAVK